MYCGTYWKQIIISVQIMIKSFYRMWHVSAINSLLLSVGRQYLEDTIPYFSNRRLILLHRRFDSSKEINRVDRDFSLCLFFSVSVCLSLCVLSLSPLSLSLSHSVSHSVSVCLYYLSLSPHSFSLSICVYLSVCISFLSI